MKNLTLPHRISFLRMLLLMTVLAILRPAATIRTATTEEKRNLTLLSEESQIKSFKEDVKFSFISKQTLRSTTWQEDEEMENGTLSTQRDSWTTPMTTLTGEPSAPERGTSQSTEKWAISTKSKFPVIFETKNVSTTAKEFEDSAISTFPTRGEELIPSTESKSSNITLKKISLYKSNKLHERISSAESLETLWTSPQSSSTEEISTKVRNSQASTPRFYMKENESVQEKMPKAWTSLPESTESITWTTPTARIMPDIQTALGQEPDTIIEQVTSSSNPIHPETPRSIAAITETNAHLKIPEIPEQKQLSSESNFSLIADSKAEIFKLNTRINLLITESTPTEPTVSRNMASRVPSKSTTSDQAANVKQVTTVLMRNTNDTSSNQAPQTNKQNSETIMPENFKIHIGRLMPTFVPEVTTDIHLESQISIASTKKGTMETMENIIQRVPHSSLAQNSYVSQSAKLSENMEVLPPAILKQNGSSPKQKTSINPDMNNENRSTNTMTLELNNSANIVRLETTMSLHREGTESNLLGTLNSATWNLSVVNEPTKAIEKQINFKNPTVKSESTINIEPSNKTLELTSMSTPPTTESQSYPSNRTPLESTPVSTEYKLYSTPLKSTTLSTKSTSHLRFSEYSNKPSLESTPTSTQSKTYSTLLELTPLPTDSESYSRSSVSSNKPLIEAKPISTEYKSYSTLLESTSQPTEFKSNSRFSGSSNKTPLELTTLPSDSKSYSLNKLSLESTPISTESKSNSKSSVSLNKPPLESTPIFTEYKSYSTLLESTSLPTEFKSNSRLSGFSYKTHLELTLPTDSKSYSSNKLESTPISTESKTFSTPLESTPLPTESKLYSMSSVSSNKPPPESTPISTESKSYSRSSKLMYTTPLQSKSTFAESKIYLTPKESTPHVTVDSKSFLRSSEFLKTILKVSKSEAAIGSANTIQNSSSTVDSNTLSITSLELTSKHPESTKTESLPVTVDGLKSYSRSPEPSNTTLLVPTTICIESESYFTNTGSSKMTPIESLPIFTESKSNSECLGSSNTTPPKSTIIPTDSRSYITPLESISLPNESNSYSRSPEYSNIMTIESTTLPLELTSVSAKSMTTVALGLINASPQESSTTSAYSKTYSIIPEFLNKTTSEFNTINKESASEANIRSKNEKVEFTLKSKESSMIIEEKATSRVTANSKLLSTEKLEFSNQIPIESIPIRTNSTIIGTPDPSNIIFLEPSPINTDITPPVLGSSNKESPEPLTGTKEYFFLSTFTPESSKTTLLESSTLHLGSQELLNLSSTVSKELRTSPNTESIHQTHLELTFRPTNPTLLETLRPVTLDSETIITRLLNRTAFETIEVTTLDPTTMLSGHIDKTLKYTTVASNGQRTIVTGSRNTTVGNTIQEKLAITNESPTAKTDSMELLKSDPTKSFTLEPTNVTKSFITNLSSINKTNQSHTKEGKNLSEPPFLLTKWTTLKGKSVEMTYFPDTNDSKVVSPVEIKKDTVLIKVKPTLFVRTKQKQTQIERTFHLKDIPTESYEFPKISQITTSETLKNLARPTNFFVSTNERTSTIMQENWPTVRRRKTKLRILKQHLLHNTTENPAPIFKNLELAIKTTIPSYISADHKKEVNSSLQIVLASKTTLKPKITYIMKFDSNITTPESLIDKAREVETKNQWYLLNFNSNNEGRINNPTKLAFPEGELIYHRKLNKLTDLNRGNKNNTMMGFETKSDNVTSKNDFKTRYRGKTFKTTNNSAKNTTDEFKKESEGRRSYDSNDVEKKQNGESPMSNKNEGKINHIEEILLKYYEEFKNRNTMIKNQEQKNKKSVPAKRKLKIKKRPATSETKNDSSPKCIQPTVVNRKYLNSSHMSLSYILKEQFINFRSLEYLDLSHNTLKRFNLSTLNNLNTLKYVRLEYNNLTDLYPLNFYTLRNLEYLDLSNNHIQKIRNYTFINMRRLKYLNLNTNFMSKINATTLRGLQGLIHLDLSSNKIEYIHVESLPRIPSLKYLNLSRNKISTIAIRNLKNIQTVDLSHNEINSLGNITLGNLTNQMKVLKLNNNLLEHLNENIFKNFSKLIYLDVSNNKLNYISPSTFQYLYNLIFLNVSCQNILPIDQKGSSYFIENNLNSNNEDYSNVKTNFGLQNKSIMFSKKLNRKFSYEIGEAEKGGRTNRSEYVSNYQSSIKSNLTANNTNRTRKTSKNKNFREDSQKESKQTINNRIMKRTNSINKKKANFVPSGTNYNNEGKQYTKKHRIITSTMRNIPDIIDFKLNLLASISQRLKRFECINVNLNHVPKVLTHSIQILNLKLNKIKILQLGDLDDYPLLQILILSQNKIKLIETDSLGRLDYLKILLVDNNKLKSVPISLPENIEILNLNYNIVSRIGQEDFFDLVNLEELYLQGNKIEYIPPNTFTFLRNLKRLDLSTNPIRTINSIVLGKLNFINLSNLKQIDSNVSDRFPIEDGYSLIGIKLSESVELCRLLLDDYAFVLTLKQIKYLNCGPTHSNEESLVQTTTERRNTTCEPGKITREREPKVLKAIRPNSNATDRSQTKFITTRKIMTIGQPDGCVNNESNILQIGNSNMARKRLNKGYRKTINTNLTVNNILFNVNKCTICKVDRIYEPLFEFNLANVENYIENVISFANISNYTNTSTYLKYVMEEQQGNCVHRGSKTTGGYFDKPDVNYSENYTPMNNSTDVLTFPTRNNNISSFANKSKMSSNRIFTENSSENDGISIITKDSDIYTKDFSPTQEKSPTHYSKIAYKHRYLQNMDFEMNDQAVPNNSTNSLIKINNIKQNSKDNVENNQLREENKFSIVKDSKKNVILKLNRSRKNESEEKLTENYDQLEIKDSSNKENDKQNEKHKKIGSEVNNFIRDSKKVMIVKNGNTIQSSENNRNRQEKINSGRMDEDQKLVSTRMESSQDEIYGVLKTYRSLNRSNPSASQQIPNTILDSHKKEIDRILTTENTNTHEQINQIRSYLKTYQSINQKDFERQRIDNTANERQSTNPLFSASLNHRDAQYELNIVDTDAEFLDIIDDKTEKIIDDNTVRTLETSKYHELVSENTLEGMQYHTGIIIFLMIVVLMIVAAFLALNFQWNTLMHHYCHHYVSYRNNGQSDDEDQTDSNFDRIEMLDNTEVYSIT